MGRKTAQESYKALLLRVLDDLEDEKPNDPLAASIIAALWINGDLAGVSDRFTALRRLPPHIRADVRENAEREGQAIIAAKPEPISFEEWAARVEGRRK